MSRDLEYISCERFFQVIEENFPDRSITSIAEEAKVSDDRFRKMKKQATISLTLADSLLTNLDLNHLLATGEIPIYSRAEERILRLEKELNYERARYRKQHQRAEDWKRKAERALDQVRYLQRPLSR